ncbi:ATP-dependent Clp protease adaptor protein ClpS [Microbacterium proteolyticum]|nr:ATP-dependent Clp protease adaptor protein ClpS [Microbacterium sp. SORGH_AS_0344]MDQ1170678.1 ATP-dependent Clp protease adaptor protein ClpS [Microbacterium proteolyticum]
MMAGLAAPEVDSDIEHDLSRQSPSSWQTVVWNDPVNLMSYVTHVFRTYFGFDAATAHRLMLAVHHDGHAVVARGPREVMEAHTLAMHDFGLWATVRKEPS